MEWILEIEEITESTTNLPEKRGNKAWFQKKKRIGLLINNRVRFIIAPKETLTPNTAIPLGHTSPKKKPSVLHLKSFIYSFL